MAGKRRRRFWSDDEKCRIVAQTRVPGSSVSRVARRYDVNANLVFKWVRDPRFFNSVEPVSFDAAFLPVEVCPQAAVLDAPSIGPEQVCPEAQRKIEISLTNGQRLEITGDFDPDAVVHLVRGLSS